MILATIYVPRIIGGLRTQGNDFGKIKLLERIADAHNLKVK